MAEGATAEWFHRVSMPGPGSPLDLILEADLYITEGGFGRYPYMYPVTIVQARYSGSYEGGAWLAFPAAPGELGREGAWRGWDGGDIPCMEWWARASAEGWPVGRGAYAEAAHKDLLRRVAEAAGVTLAGLSEDPAWPGQPDPDAGEGGDPVVEH